MLQTQTYPKILASGLLAISLLAGCSDNDDSGSNGKLSISASASFSGTTAKSGTAKMVNANVDVTEFRINLKEFELEADFEEMEMEGESEMENDESWDDDGFYDYEDEIELEGPFELDLMDGQITFINASIPEGVYEEIEFKFGKSTDPDSELYGKSILIEGTIDAVPFVFWHDFEDEVELDFEDAAADITISNTPEGVVIDFDLAQIFNGAVGVDLTVAKDGNGDGLIEISPSDPDGNNDLAQTIRDLIKEEMDLLDD